MFDGQAPITGAITIGEAIARALKYNLDNRLKMMESALAEQRYDLDSWDLLPSIIASVVFECKKLSGQESQVSALLPVRFAPA